MNGKTILTELGGIDGSFILQASPDARPKKNLKRPLALAACLALIVAGGLAGYGYRRAHGPADVRPPVTTGTGDPADTANTDDTLPPDTAGDDTAAPHLTLTAEEAGAAFRQVKMMGDGMPTRAYQKVYAPDVSYLGLRGTEAAYLPGYAYEAPDTVPDSAELQDFANGILPRLARAAGLSVPAAAPRVGLGGWPEMDFDVPGYPIIVFQKGDANYLSLSHAEGPLALNGVPVAVDQSLSDEQIIAALEPLRRELSAIFGVSLPDIRVSRHYDSWSEHGAAWLDVYFYDASAHPLNAYLDVPVSDYVQLSFDNAENYPGDIVSDRVLGVVTVSCRQGRVSPGAGYCEKDYGPLMGLEKAEEYLRKGWVFGGHSCPLCMAEQETVTFDTYDAWGLTYITTWNEAGDTVTGALPFYVFYKALGKAENGNVIYAQTYVPAVEVSGMAEYFEAQAQYHEEARSGGGF